MLKTFDQDRTRRRSLALIGRAALALVVSGGALLAHDWPSWRGPEQTGVARETGLPAKWMEEGENLLWKRPYGARSTPVVHDGHLYLLNLAGEGAMRQERLQCLDPESGRILWEHRFNVFLTDIPDSRVGWSNPVVDPETGFVYVHGVQGYLKCLDRDGAVLWERSLTEEFGRISGYGGRTHTPVIDEERLIISFLNSSWGAQARGLHRYLALDKRTGSVIWWAAPGGAPRDTTYSTPVVTVIDGVRLLIAGNADGAIYAMKARTGETVWRFGLSKRGINVSVVERDGLVYAAHSEENIDTTGMGRVVCIDARGKGDITKTHEKWRADELTVGYSSLALDDENLYVADNSANLYCLDATTGKKKWQANVGTAMRGSPVVADGKVYIGAMSGSFSVVDARTGERLDHHEFVTEDGRIVEVNGSAAVANGRVYFPTRLHLYCIGEEEWKGESKPLPEPPEEAELAEGAEPAHLEVIPGEVAVYPGQRASFKARLFDEGGRFLRGCVPSWTLTGLQGEISTDGRLEIDAGSSFQGGLVKAQLGELAAEARVRVLPTLPFTYDFEDVPEGGVPPGWVGASPVKFQVVERDGSKVLMKRGDNPRFMDAETFFGHSTWSDYTLQADVMVAEKRRQIPNVGIIVNRYNFMLMGNHQRVRVISWVPMPRVEQKEKFRIDPDVWYRMKLRIDRRDDQAVVRGKIWPRESSEPEAWTVTLTDPSPNRSGAPGLHGYTAGVTDRYPGPEIFWDNIAVTPNE